MRDFSANGGQPVGNNIVPDGMGEGDRLAVTDGYDINAATLKLVEENSQGDCDEVNPKVWTD